MDICHLWTHTRARDCVGTEDRENTEQGKETRRGTAVRYAFDCPHLPHFAVSLVFFKAQSVSDAFYFLRNISFQTHASWKEINIGMPDHICIVAGSAFLLILLYDYFMSKSDLLLRFENSGPSFAGQCII